MSQNNIKSLENDLWESADALREGSKLSSQEYCMPVLGLIYLRYAFTRFKYVEAEILVPPKVNLDKFAKANKVVKHSGCYVDFSRIPVV